MPRIRYDDRKKKTNPLLLSKADNIIRSYHAKQNKYQKLLSSSLEKVSPMKQLSLRNLGMALQQRDEDEEDPMTPELGGLQVKWPLEVESKNLKQVAKEKLISTPIDYTLNREVKETSIPTIVSFANGGNAKSQKTTQADFDVDNINYNSEISSSRFKENVLAHKEES